jgi:hypothetical protein
VGKRHKKSGRTTGQVRLRKLLANLKKNKIEYRLLETVLAAQNYDAPKDNPDRLFIVYF